jgi:hypothetical protein
MCAVLVVHAWPSPKTFDVCRLLRMILPTSDQTVFLTVVRSPPSTGEMESSNAESWRFVMLCFDPVQHRLASCHPVLLLSLDWLRTRFLRPRLSRMVTAQLAVDVFIMCESSWF